MRNLSLVSPIILFRHIYSDLGGLCLLSWVERQILEFGKRIQQVGLAGVVMDLYDSAIQESSRRQYGTGQRAYLRFAGKLRIPGGFFPFQKRKLKNTELTLAFFMAHLVLKPTIKKASTILCYETHVKWMFRREGCDPEEYQTPFLQQVRTGLKKTLPSKRDSRSALILPVYLKLQLFHMTTSRDLMLLKFAVIIGFVGMLRPHTFDQLTRLSFMLVVKDEQSRRLSQMVATTDMNAVRN